MKRTIEIEDTLQENIDSCKEQLLERLAEYVESNTDITDFDEFQDNASDIIHEIVDSTTPIYYHEINGTYFLYGSQLDEAFDNAGISTRDECDNYEQTAIYCLLSEKTFEFLNELEDGLTEIIEKRDELTNDMVQTAFIISAVGEFVKAQIEEL